MTKAVAVARHGYHKLDLLGVCILQIIAWPMIMAPLDAWLLGFPWNDDDFVSKLVIPNTFAPFVLMGLYLVNAVLIDRMLVSITPRPSWFKKRVRLARFLWAGVPILGMFVIPWWQSILQNSASPALVSERSTPILQKAHSFRPGKPFFGFWNRSRGLSIFSFLYILNFVVGVLLFARNPYFSETPIQMVPMAGVFILLVHVYMAAVFGMFLLEHLKTKKYDGPTGILLTCPLFMLLPIPVLGFGGLVVLVALDFSHALGGKHLVANICDSGRLSGGLLTLEAKLWSGSEEVSPPPSNEPDFKDKVEIPSTQTTNIKICALAKIAILFLEAAPLGNNLYHIHTGTADSIDGIVTILYLIHFFLGACGLMLMMFLFFRRIRRPDKYLDLPFPNGASSWFTASQLTMYAGVQFGMGYFMGKPGAYAGVIVILGTLGALTFFMPMIIKVFKTLPEFVDMNSEMAFMVGYVILMSMGLSAGLIDDHLNTYALYYPWIYLVGPLIGYNLGEWLLRPYTWKDLWRKRLHPKDRQVVTLTAITLLAPFGGLAAPWWIYRHNKAYQARIEGKQDTAG